MIAVIPITSGIADATSAPNTKSRRRNVSGTEMLSALARSFSIRPLMAFEKTASPET